jgi:hypothetical protein
VVEEEPPEIREQVGQLFVPRAAGLKIRKTRTNNSVNDPFEQIVTLGAFRSVSAWAAPGQPASSPHYLSSPTWRSTCPWCSPMWPSHVSGLDRTALVYWAMIATLVVVAAGSLIVRRRSPVPGTRSSGSTSQ